MNRLNSFGKNVLLSGVAAGIVSLIPLINIINFPLMLWMGGGGALCVVLLLRDNARLRPSEALLTGALSGALGGGIFGTVIYFLVTNISPEKMERMMSLINMFVSSPEEEAEMMELFHGNHLAALTLTVVGIALLISILIGALGGIIALKIDIRQKAKCKR
jgi:hypothetical protein